jgi:hypothetical protein
VEEYSLFKKNIEPEWGDPANVVGGEWFCRQSFDGESLDLYWQNLVLAAIGEAMEDMEPPPTADGTDVMPPPPTLTSMVNGVRVVDKSRTFPMFKLEIWLSTRDPTLREQIKEKLQEIMTNGQSPSSRKAHPKWEWKDHT